MAEFNYRFLGVVQNWLTWEFRGKIANLAKNHDFARMNGYEARSRFLPTWQFAPEFTCESIQDQPPKFF